MVTYKQEQVLDYVQVHSGRKFSILDPKPEQITVDDIAHSLSNLARFTGHGDRFYCVGEHSIQCARVARKAGFSTLTQIYCLGHDASESIVNDVARPVKQNLPQYKELEDNIMSVMWEVLGVPAPTEEEYKLVKQVDNTLLMHELQQLMKRSTDDYPKVDYLPIYIDLTYGYGSGQSKQDFMKIYSALMEEYRLEQKLK